MSLLPDAESFRRLVDGTARGPGPMLARTALRVAEVPYAAAVRLRNLAFDRGLFARARAAVPVISIGNLTVGGTGKTPLVAWTVRLLVRHGLQPAIVSRGYGARPGQRSDEAAELAMLLPGVGHHAAADRRAAVARAVAAGADVIVLDDGFQHRRLHRDLDIVVVDATDPLGGGHVLPRGLLRESPAGIARADAVVLSRISSATETRRAAIRTELATACGGRLPPVWAECDHRPVGLRTADGRVESLDRLVDARLFAFCGIGNPAAFRDTLARISGREPAGFRGYTDHHAYSPADLDSIASAARSMAADLVVTTLKDLVRVQRTELGGLPLAAVEIAIEFAAGAAGLESAILAACGRPSRGSTP